MTAEFLRPATSKIAVMVLASALLLATPAPAATPTKQQNCTASPAAAGGSGNSQKPQNCTTKRGGFGGHGLFHRSGG